MEDKNKEETIKEMAEYALKVLREKFPNESKHITEEMIENVLKETL